MKRASTCSPASSNRAILAALQPSQILSGSYGLRTAGRQIDKAQIKAQMKIVASSDVGRPG